MEDAATAYVMAARDGRAPVPWVSVAVLGMFFAGALWRLPVYAQDVAARNVGGAGLSLVTTLVGMVVFGLSGAGLWRRQRWATVVTAIALGLTGAFILVSADGDPHYAAAIFGAVLAFLGVAGLLPLCRRAS